LIFFVKQFLTQKYKTSYYNNKDAKIVKGCRKTKKNCRFFINTFCSKKNQLFFARFFRKKIFLQPVGSNDF